jgi:hypothetical protein
MKTKKMTIIMMIMMLGLSSFSQETEKRFGIELNGGASFSATKPENTTLNTGFGFEGLLQYQFMKNTSIYGGWGWNRFGADDSFAGKDVCFEETGYILGLQYKHSFQDSPFSVFLRGGGLYNHIEIEDADGDIIHDSKHGFGWQAAAGFGINLGSGWSINPGVKFNYLVKESSFQEISRTLNMNYFSARVGFVKLF